MTTPEIILEQQRKQRLELLRIQVHTEDSNGYYINRNGKLEER